MTLADRWMRLLLVALGSAAIAFIVALLIVMSQNGHQGTNALFVYGP
jgi:hypothetical protein